MNIEQILTPVFVFVDTRGDRTAELMVQCRFCRLTFFFSVGSLLFGDHLTRFSYIISCTCMQVWFQNRRAKFRKQERLTQHKTDGKDGQQQQSSPSEVKENHRGPSSVGSPGDMDIKPQMGKTRFIYVLNLLRWRNFGTLETRKVVVIHPSFSSCGARMDHSIVRRVIQSEQTERLISSCCAVQHQ